MLLADLAQRVHDKCMECYWRQRLVQLAAKFVAYLLLPAVLGVVAALAVLLFIFEIMSW